MIREITGCFAVAGKETGTVTVFVIINQRHGFIEIGNTNHAEYRPKNFLLVTRHCGLHMIDERTTDKKPAIGIRHLGVTTIDNDACPGFLRAANETDNAITVLCRDQRPKVVAGFAVTTHFELSHFSAESRN